MVQQLWLRNNFFLFLSWSVVQIVSENVLLFCCLVPYEEFHLRYLYHRFHVKFYKLQYIAYIVHSIAVQSSGILALLKQKKLLPCFVGCLLASELVAAAFSCDAELVRSILRHSRTVSRIRFGHRTLLQDRQFVTCNRTPATSLTGSTTARPEIAPGNTQAYK